MKIDTTKITGFDTLSAEEKLNALLDYEFDVEDTAKLKDALNKASSQAADYKRQLKEKMSEQERIEADRQAKEAEREELLKNLMREKTIADNRAQFLAVGYGEELANKSAEAMADGNMAEIFNGFKTFVETRDKAIRAELIKGTPAPKGGNTDTTITKEQFRAMSYSERNKLYTENPELYKQLRD